MLLRSRSTQPRHATHRNILQRLFEGKRHATTYDERINLQTITSVVILSTGNNLYNLIEHVINQLDFIRHLGATKNSQERFVWVLQGLCKEL
jgi:hypothetical protein